MTKGKLICIIGIDGSGKTTQARQLVRTLSDRGISCKYRYGRIIPLLPRPFMYLGKKVFLKNSDSFKDFRAHSVKKRRLFSNSGISRIYQGVFLLDYLIQAIMKIRIPLLFGNNIVSDRYVYDTVITDLAVDLGYSEEKIGSLIRQLLLMLPKPDITFYIDTPEQIAMSRKTDVPSVDYLIERRSRYSQVANSWGMEIVDGAESIDEVRNSITRKALKLFEGEMSD